MTTASRRSFRRLVFHLDVPGGREHFLLLIDGITSAASASASTSTIPAASALTSTASTNSGASDAVATDTATATTQTNSSWKLHALARFHFLFDSTLSDREDLRQKETGNDHPGHQAQHGLSTELCYFCAAQFLVFVLPYRTHGIVVPQHCQLKVNVGTCLTFVDVSIQILGDASVVAE